MKFLKHFNVLQSKPSVKTVHFCKTPVTYKPARPNIDDTDTEDDSDGSQSVKGFTPLCLTWAVVTW